MSHKQLTDVELDALVVRSLSRLPSLAPSRAFGAKVMARVRLPEPRAVRLYHRARSWVAQPRRAVVLAGAYIVSALIALGVAVPWLFAHRAQVAFGLDWMAGRGLTLVRGISTAFAGWTLSSGLAQRVQSLPLTTPAAVAAGLAVTTAYVAGAIGLRSLMRAPRQPHAIPVQA